MDVDVIFSCQDYRLNITDYLPVKYVSQLLRSADSTSFLKSFQKLLKAKLKVVRNPLTFVGKLETELMTYLSFFLSITH